MILKVFFNLNDSMIPWYCYCSCDLRPAQARASQEA